MEIKVATEDTSGAVFIQGDINAGICYKDTTLLAAPGPDDTDMSERGSTFFGNCNFTNCDMSAVVPGYGYQDVLFYDCKFDSSHYENLIGRTLLLNAEVINCNITVNDDATMESIRCCSKDYERKFHIKVGQRSSLRNIIVPVGYTLDVGRGSLFQDVVVNGQAEIKFDEHTSGCIRVPTHRNRKCRVINSAGHVVIPWRKINDSSPFIEKETFTSETACRGVHCSIDFIALYKMAKEHSPDNRHYMLSVSWD